MKSWMKFFLQRFVVSFGLFASVPVLAVGTISYYETLGGRRAIGLIETTVPFFDCDAGEEEDVLSSHYVFKKDGEHTLVIKSKVLRMTYRLCFEEDLKTGKIRGLFFCDSNWRFAGR